MSHTDLGHNIPFLGIEPAANIVQMAREKDIRSKVRFFGREVARELVRAYGKPDLVLGNNVLPHLPDLNDFVAGIKLLLEGGGILAIPEITVF